MRYVKFTMREIYYKSESEFIDALFQHTENRTIAEAVDDDKEKIDSWKDCRSFFKSYMDQINMNQLWDIPVCFEYQIFDGTWIDAVIVCNDKLMILEFKSGVDCREETLEGHRAQIVGYYNKITRCNKVIWEELKSNLSFSVEKYLVYTNPAMIGKTGNYNYIRVCDDFLDVMRAINEPADDNRIQELLEFVQELDITTTGVMKDILHRNVLSEMYVQDDNVIACAEIVDTIQQQNEGLNLNLIFIKGAPGTGKTGTAFSLLEKYIDKGAKYVTGNGNLSNIFRQMIRDDNITGAEAAAVGSLHDLYSVSNFCEKYRSKKSIKLQPVNSKLLIIDEAQRVWNPIQVALAKKNKLSTDQRAFIIKKEVSEAMMVLRAVLQEILRDNTSRTVVFLLGSGQEIYIGEEDGEVYIQKAIKHLVESLSKRDKQAKAVGIHLFVPTHEMADTYRYLGHTCEVKTGLLLEENKRNTYNDSALGFVNMIIDGSTPLLGDDLKDAFYVFNDCENMKNALEPINTGAFSVGLVANGFDTLTEWEPGRYGKYKPISYLNLCGQKIRNISNEELKDFYINKTSNGLKSFASQFNCQGLELDYTVMIWGDMMLRRNNSWELSSKSIRAIDKYCEELSALLTAHPELTGITADKEALRNTFIKNCYRVLLTRARIATYIFIEDDETYQYIKSVIRDI